MRSGVYPLWMRESRDYCKNLTREGSMWSKPNQRISSWLDALSASAVSRAPLGTSTRSRPCGAVDGRTQNVPVPLGTS